MNMKPYDEIVKLAFARCMRSDAPPMSNADIAMWCHSMAKSVYPDCHHEWVNGRTIDGVNVYDCAHCKDKRTESP